MPLLITTLVCLVLWGLFELIFKRGVKAGILVGVLLLIVFMYGPLHIVIYFNGFNIGPVQIVWSYAYLFVSLIFFIATIIILVKAKRRLLSLNKILNVGGLILMALVLVPLLYNYARIHLKIGQTSPEAAGNFSNSVSDARPSAAYKPDIYYIIPDDYGSPDILKQDYGFDDSQFTNYLKEKGFYIADKSKTNYPFSTYMIASALNMDYLNAQTLPTIKDEPGGTVIDNALQDSKVLNFIKSQGYSYFHIGSWYDPLRDNSLADINFTLDTALNLDEFTNTLLHNTIFYPFILRYYGLSGRPNQIANTNYQYETLAEMPDQLSPKFVFVDILSPHTPYIYDPNCNVVTKPLKEMVVNNFISQVQCVNKRLTETIDAILQNSKTPPIIILQTDEGAKDDSNQALKYPDPTGVKGGFKNSSVETNLERTKILNAFYLPGGHAGKLYPEISPVNTFRLVFDEYFNAKLPLLPDKVYTFDDYDKLYRLEFNDVTGQVGSR